MSYAREQPAVDSGSRIHDVNVVRAFRTRLGLVAIQPGVQAAAVQQLGVGAALDQAAAVQLVVSSAEVASSRNRAAVPTRTAEIPI